MNLGAFDYIVKPLELDGFIAELEPVIIRAASIVQLTKEHVRLHPAYNPRLSRVAGHREWHRIAVLRRRTAFRDRPRAGVPSPGACRRQSSSGIIGACPAAWRCVFRP
ncbi:MAG: hypothetical protein ACM3U2_20820 [Deltaproteobacteria bacterium]